MKKTDRTTAFEGGPCIPGAYCSGDNVSVFADGNDGPQEANGHVSSEIRKLCYAHDGVMKFESHLKCDQIQEYVNVLEITPKDQDPVLYWHQVAMDAIKAQESAQNRAKQANEERAKAQRAFDDLTEKTAQRIADYKMRVDKETQEVPFDLSRLVGMARSGDVDLNVNIQIKGKRRMPQYEHEEDD